MNRDASCDLPVIYRDILSCDSQITYMYMSQTVNSTTIFVSLITFSTCAKLEAWDFNKVIIIIYKDSVMEFETSL